MIIDIALAASRRTKTWKNKKMPWAELVKKLETTTRTSETYATYVNSSKEFQSEKKDVGGFVGGYLIDGKRTPVTNVKHRQLITLDIDFGVTNVWEDFTFIYGCEAVAYSTHKHSPEAPRLRLVIPLDRPVSREEYEAIARKIADNIGMEYFDSTTFQPQRLMYWPSTSIDGEYYYQYQNTGDFLCADDILATYVDWKDISAWPMTANEDITVSGEFKKAGDPTTKPGLIGAFCRAYNAVEAAEEFLDQEYEHTDKEDYMTYSLGSTAAGVKVYGDGDFFYSFHNTDPTHGKLVNAFDLVRIHKFGHLDDEGTKESNKAMREFASGLDLVKKEIALNAFDVFADEPDTTVEQKDWLPRLSVDKAGDVEPTINNIILIINNDLELKNKIRYNEFEANIYILSNVPWDDKVRIPRPFIDSDDASMRHYLEQVYKIFNTGKTFDAINISAKNNSYHPIKDYLEPLVWDGIPRIEMLLIDHMGAENSNYTKEVTKKTLVAAIARVYRPGIKFDTVLTLVGGQGIGKSTFFNMLGRDWFSDSFTTVQGKEAFEQLQGNWIIEIAELSAFKKSEVEQIKQFLSKRSDKFRVAYGRRVETFLRQCIMVGTTNESSFLKDYTGNRRFWPVTVTKGAKELPIDQLWAEAKVLYEAGETIYLDEATETEAKLVQASHTEAEERIGVVEKFLEMKIPADWNKCSILYRKNYMRSEDDIREFGTEERVSVCVAEIFCELLEQDFNKMTSVNTKYIHQVLSQLPGWVKSNSIRNFGPYGRQRAYVKIDTLKENKAKEYEKRD